MISATTQIAAPPDEVWATLTDFADYPSWNPFITEASGEVTEGATLTLRMVSGDTARTFTPTVLAARPGEELRWLGVLYARWIFGGEHRFTLRPTDDGTELIQSECFTGILVPFLSKLLTQTEHDFHAMNAALKARAEDS
jgi:hypothetical protein